MSRFLSAIAVVTGVLLFASPAMAAEGGSALGLLGQDGGIDLKAIGAGLAVLGAGLGICLLYTSPSPRDATLSRMPSSA